MATHSSILPWRIPWSLAGYSHKNSGTTEQLTLLLLYFLSELRAGRIFCLFVSLGLRCCMWSLSSCREQGFLSSGVDGLLLLQSMESRCMGFSKCGAWAWPSTAGGILLNQGLNLCLLHWQTDSYPPAKSRRVLLLMFSRGPPPPFSAMW